MGCRKWVHRRGSTDIVCFSRPRGEQHQSLSLTVCVRSALHRTRLHVGEGPLGAGLAEHILRFAAPPLHPEPRRAPRVGPALRAALSRQEAVRRTGTYAVLRGRAGSFFDQTCSTRSPATVALRDAILPTREGTLRTGAALPLRHLGAVDGHICACGALVAD